MHIPFRWIIPYNPIHHDLLLMDGEPAWGLRWTGREVKPRKNSNNGSQASFQREEPAPPLQAVQTSQM